VSTLAEANGNPVTNHSEKVEINLQAYKGRLGQTETTTPLPNLQQLIHVNEDLSFLEAPFTHKEIDDVVKDFPNNKSPGRDGFNAELLTKCWHIIKHDFYDLCERFHLCLQSINSCFITLVPKTADASSVNDFRPISLLKCTLKIITKLLANRLQTVIQKLIHEN
jgi:hypothetical protein